MKRRVRRGFTLLAALLLVVFLSACAYRIVTLNAASPPHERFTYSPDEEVAFPMYDKQESQPIDSRVRIAVTGSYLASHEEVKKRYPEYDDSFVDAEKLGYPKHLIVEADLRNASAKDMSVPLGDIVAEAGAWTNGIEAQLFRTMNEGSAPVVKLAPGERRRVLLPYALYKPQFGFSSTWDALDKKDFELVLATYPDKVSIKIGKVPALSPKTGNRGER